MKKVEEAYIHQAKAVDDLLHIAKVLFYFSAMAN